MYDTSNDFEALKNACTVFTTYAGFLESELAKNGCGSETRVKALTTCTAQAAKQVMKFQGQTFLSIYGNQPEEMITSVIAKCTKLEIVF